MKNEKTNRVNEVLRLPLAAEFERDIRAALSGAGEAGVVVLAFLDLDNFLKVNESFGFAAGDEVMIQTGEYLRQNLPEGAGLYRYGGDQFAALFQAGLEKEDVLLRMEELRRGFSVKTPDGAAQTLSIGISAAPEDGERAEELIRKADSALFRGKAIGKNRVCLAREEKMVTKTSHYTADQLQRLTKVSKREGMGEAILLREALDALLKKYDA